MTATWVMEGVAMVKRCGRGDNDCVVGGDPGPVFLGSGGDAGDEQDVLYTCLQVRCWTHSGCRVLSSVVMINRPTEETIEGARLRLDWSINRPDSTSGCPKGGAFCTLWYPWGILNLDWMPIFTKDQGYLIWWVLSKINYMSIDGRTAQESYQSKSPCNDKECRDRI